jgi:hypothetical protein
MRRAARRAPSAQRTQRNVFLRQHDMDFVIRRRPFSRFLADFVNTERKNGKPDNRQPGPADEPRRDYGLQYSGLKGY